MQKNVKTNFLFFAYRIDNEIHDTLLNRQVSLESDTVLLASQKSFKLEAKELE